MTSASLAASPRFPVDLLLIDTHTAFRLFTCVHAGALLAFSMMAWVAPGFLRTARGAATIRMAPWGWLGAFAFMKALSVGTPMALGMIERLAPNDVFRAIYLSFAGAAWTLALEFGLRWLAPRSRFWRATSWVVLGAWAWPLLGQYWSLAALAVAWLAAVPAAVIVAVAAWRANRRNELRLRRGMLAIGFAALGGLAALETFGLSYSDWFQGWTANTFTWFDQPAPFVLLATALSLLLLAAWSWWMIAQFVVGAAGPRGSLPGLAAVIGPAVGMLGLSGFVVVWLDRAGRRHNVVIRPAIYSAVTGLATRLDPLFAEAAPDGMWNRALAERVRTRLGRPDMLAGLTGTEGFIVSAVRSGQVVSLVKVPADLPSVPPVPMDNAKLFFPPRTIWRQLAQSEKPFTPPAMLDARSLHVIHSVPLAVKLPTGERLWLGLRQNFAAWDAYKREVYVQGIFTLGLAGVVGGVFGIFLLRVRREHQLELARDHAEAANHAKSEFIAFVSHELRTPLQGVLGYADILRGRPNHPTRHEFLDALSLQARELLNVVNELLDFSAAEAGRLRLDPAAFAVRDLVTDCVQTVAPVVQAKRLAWEMSIDPAVPEHVIGDRARLRQILVNVMGNAVKFTDDGQVSVRVERADAIPASRELPTRTPTVSSSAIHIRFVVRDTGPGIPEHERSRLFEVFGRLHDKVRGGKTGSGLGLALSRKLCWLMGGTISLENRTDGVSGAVATLVVPVAVASELPSPAPSNLACSSEATRPPSRANPKTGDAIAAPAKSMRILLAEDHPHVREVICEMLAGLGCAVDTAENGVEAAALVQQGGYDIILLDTWMPGLSGMQVAHEIRTVVSTERRPWIIGISASSRPEDASACLAAGMDDFLSKPVDRSVLLDALHRASRAWTVAEHETSTTTNARQSALTFPDRSARSSPGFDAEVTAALDTIAHAVSKRAWRLAHERAHYLENSALCQGHRDFAASCAILDRALRSHDASAAVLELERLQQTSELRSTAARNSR